VQAVRREIALKEDILKQATSEEITPGKGSRERMGSQRGPGGGRITWDSKDNQKRKASHSKQLFGGGSSGIVRESLCWESWSQDRATKGGEGKELCALN